MQRGVPRQYYPDHAKRIAAGVNVVVRPLVDNFTVHNVHDATVELEKLRCEVNERRHLVPGLSSLCTFDFTETLSVCSDHPTQFNHSPATFGWPHVTPFRKCIIRHVDCLPHLCGATVGDLLQLLPGPRIDLYAKFIDRRPDVFTADVVVDPDRHSFLLSSILAFEI
ncbi:hypothetical protein AGR13a_Lc30077 [Agrobacterium genomosp. 13 str. CFBP 6927]|uniref:Uncharacterized protein n=1 Tax=Agrobacterium genomosp. 13 str. CFBP 6927 TaxID=1183428 RepID=A0ABM9VLS5_9HYPH|nr:hypothetical protein AGR13a_Lc30077 [Agrobacterium genomosp. 13 str. CFBP 6927]